jgi:hypothetical protein
VTISAALSHNLGLGALITALSAGGELVADDEVDACSGALEMLNPDLKGWGGRPLPSRCTADVGVSAASRAQRAGQGARSQIAGQVPPVGSEGAGCRLCKWERQSG